MSRSLEARRNRVWISCRLFTVAVTTEWGVITEAAPMVQRFKGQRVVNLIKWAQKFGGERHEIIGGSRFEHSETGSEK